MDLPATDTIPRAAVPEFVVMGPRSNWRTAIVGAKALEARVGTKLLGALLECFLGADRLFALEDLLVTLFKARPVENAARRRDVRAIVTLLSSTLVELSEALQRVCNAKIFENVDDRAVWLPLNEKMKLWSEHKVLRSIRNNVGHHLAGEHGALIRKGIVELVEEHDEIQFSVGNGGKRHDDEHVFGWNAMFKGMGLDKERFEEAVKITYAGHSEFADELWALWFAVLKHHGVKFRNESEDEPRRKEKRRGPRRRNQRK